MVVFLLLSNFGVTIFVQMLHYGVDTEMKMTARTAEVLTPELSVERQIKVLVIAL